MIEFPKGFLWGAATSAHQVEGNNRNNDWWESEKRGTIKEPSGQACRHYELYKEDFDSASNLGHNAHRLSIEWSRIEPEEGKISSEGLAHYREVILSLRERNIEPIVTLHHFTNPLWFSKLGGWRIKKAYRYFLHYTKTITDALCDKVRFWVTINEPMVYVYNSYILGKWPPHKKSLLDSRPVTDNLIFSHIQSYKLIHDIYKQRNLSRPFVSIAKNMQPFIPCGGALRNKFAACLRDRLYNLKFIEESLKFKALDFIGVNFYTRGLVDLEGFNIRNLLLDNCSRGHDNLAKNSLGWEIYPQGLYDFLIRLKKYNLPLMITENGICTSDDNLRWDFICQHLKSIHSAMEKGVNLLGYLHWSLLDNFEWDQGFAPRFGLIEVDYNNYKRKIRESARKFREVCINGVVK